MERKVAEKIVVTMKEVDVVLEKVHIALCEIENEEERKKIIRKYFDLIHGAVNVTMAVVEQFPDLHPDKCRVFHK